MKTSLSSLTRSLISPLSPQRSLKAFVKIFQTLMTPLSVAVMIVFRSCQTT